MKMTLTRRAANLVGYNGYLFNDRLPDGRRSLKVYGWRMAQYKRAADMLRMAGCDVQIKQGPFTMSECRLIVSEPK